MGMGGVNGLWVVLILKETDSFSQIDNKVSELMRRLRDVGSSCPVWPRYALVM